MNIGEANITGWFVPKKISINDLLLDPNNPRFLDLYKDAQYALDLDKIEKVQERVLDRMESGEFEIIELKKSIIECGFLPIDRIVVIEIPNSENKYLVIEGNRRIAAIKSILSESEFHNDDFLDTLREIEVLLMRSPDEHSVMFGKQIVQGIRNVSGIKSWRPYQQAQLINNLMAVGQSAGSIGKMIGMSTNRINRLYKTYKVLNQMRDDEEYADFWHAKLFAYFDQIMGRPVLREWLGWDSDEMQFKNNENLRLFYSWIVEKQDEEGKNVQPKISDHRLLKYLEKAINDPSALKTLKLEGKKIEDIIPIVEKGTINLYEDLKKAFQTLDEIRIDQIEKISADELGLLNDLRMMIEKRLDQYEKLK